MDQLVTIEIFGQPFTFKADTDASKAKEVADYFAEEVTRMEAGLAGTGGVPVDKRLILILTALNITQELFHYKKDHDALISKLVERSNDLIKQLDMKL